MPKDDKISFRVNLTPSSQGYRFDRVFRCASGLVIQVAVYSNKRNVAWNATASCPGSWTRNNCCGSLEKSGIHSGGAQEEGVTEEVEVDLILKG